MQLNSLSNLYKKSIVSDRFPWKIGIPLYVVSYGFMFGFLDAYFWDDWYTNVNLSPSQAHDYWRDYLGFFPTNRFVEITILGRNPILFHLLTFVIFFMISNVAFNISKWFKFISKEQRIYFAIFLLVLPINSARVSMACFRLSYSLLIFLVAWLVLVHPRTAKIKIIAMPLFIISFLAQSLIPFFVLPCMHSAYLGYSSNGGKRLGLSLARFSPILIAPAYLATAWIFSPPADIRRDYYTPGRSGIIRAVFILVIVMVFFGRTVQKNRLRSGPHDVYVNYSLSFLLLGFGSAAYIASGRLVDISEWMMNFVPRASDWESRHQLLLGIGFALLFSTLIVSVQPKVRERLFFSLVVACVILNVSMMQGYFLDAKKQDESIELLSKYGDLSTWKAVIISDEAIAYNARNRSVRSYEWEQIIIKAGGSKDIEVITSTKPCSTDETPEKYVFLQIESSRGRLKAMITGDVGLLISRKDVLVCN